jgi:hypothetical protein
MLKAKKVKTTPVSGTAISTLYIRLPHAGNNAWNRWRLNTARTAYVLSEKWVASVGSAEA